MSDLVGLYRRFYKPVRKWLERRCGFNGVDPDDVAQEVFVRLLKYPEAQSHAARDVYIFRVAANVASNYRQMSVNRMPHASVELLILDGLDEHDGFDGVQSERMDPGDALLDYGEDEELVRIGYRVHEIYPRQWELGVAARDAKAALRREWEAQREREIAEEEREERERQVRR